MKKKNGFSVISNKKGNVSVMLAMIFVCLMMVAAVLVNASASVANYSYCDGVLQLAGKSVLSEYHRALKDSYGLMAFKGYEEEVNNKLKFYAEGSFNSKLGDGFSKRKSLTLIKPKIGSMKCYLKEYSLQETENFEEEILDYMKYPKIIKTVKKGRSLESTGNLVNQRMINELPSSSFDGGTFDIKALVAGGLPSWSQIISTNTDKLIANEYILKNFNCKLTNESNIETFFQNELEYILYGKLRDEDNQRRFMGDFKLLRFALNSAHIYTDVKKMKEVLELAEILTPGPPAAATAIILAEVWALAETVNDEKLLLAGENVALNKSSSQWALSLSKSREFEKSGKIKSGGSSGNTGGTGGGSYIKPSSGEGLSYKDYIRLFLYFESRETKLARAMDLIQINLQGNFDNTFYIKDCYIGLGYNVQIKGQEYGYVQKY